MQTAVGIGEGREKTFFLLTPAEWDRVKDAFGPPTSGCECADCVRRSDLVRVDVADDGSRLVTASAGQTLAEYALILALIAVVAITALVFLGGEISSILSSIGAQI